MVNCFSDGCDAHMALFLVVRFMVASTAQIYFCMIKIIR